MRMRSKISFNGKDYSELIAQLTECALTCESCLSACLNESDITLLAQCIELDRDCADVCFLGARLLQRDSDIGHEFLFICERACRLCALECSKHDTDHCRKCTEICQQCADLCHEHHGAVALK